MVVLNLYIINEFSRAVIMFFKSNHYSRYARVDWLIEKRGMAHTNHLSNLNGIAFFDIDLSLALINLVNVNQRGRADCVNNIVVYFLHAKAH